MKFKSLIFNFRRWFILHGDCPKRFLKSIRFFSEVKNVEEKKTLIYWFTTLFVFVTPRKSAS